MAIPVTLEDAKRQLRVELDDASRDAEIQLFIDDAAAWVEQYTGHILVARDEEERFASFDRIRLRGWPIAPSAIIAVSYATSAGSVPVTGARFAGWRRPMAVSPGLGASWPAAAGGEITVEYRAGYEDGDTVPGNLRRAMLVLIAAYDDDREGADTLPKAEETARRLCANFRLRSL